MTGGGVAILSLACRLPEADDPEALWRNIAEGRRSFRPIPPARLALADYAPGAAAPSDTITPIHAGLLTGWSFDRERFRIPLSVYEGADLAHWLALQVAADAIESAGGADRLPRARTAVIFGNTLTGEFSRAAQMRLRAPYIGRRLTGVLKARGIPDADAVAADMMRAVAADFPDPDEETLAGALANTIAGRIANHFDLQGGAWTVDGACASSLLAVADACARLADGSLDAAVVGGVDLSLDPFELVGFSRAGALAVDDMRVFDRRAAGFWPGEGCGAAVLASGAMAARMGAEPIAWIRGWGVSTDGAGGLTRPTERGQALALRRAWDRAGIEPSRAGLFEAHGTGTTIGDATELRALAQVAGPDARAIPVGSIKANIGHCKAAAGIAGLLKAALAAQGGAIPPHAGAEDPSPVFAETGDRLRPADGGPWRGARLVGVSGFGFGGVNAHLVIDGAALRPRAAPAPLRPQDAELFLFAEPDQAALSARLTALRDRAGALSLAEMTDAAAFCAAAATPRAPWRAAIVAARPDALAAALDRTLAQVAGGAAAPVTRPPRIGLLFPGQAAPVRPSGGAWRRRFPDAFAPPDGAPDGATATEVAQPAILGASLIAADVLARAGVNAVCALGHSLGEIAALCWAGALDAPDAVALAARRGAIMAAHGAPGGAMLHADLDADAAAARADAFGVALACRNAPSDMVLAGPAERIDHLAAALAADGIGHGRLAVSHAFHSPDMAPAAPILADALARTPLRPLRRAALSSVTGGWIAPEDDLRDLLTRQLVAPVRFAEAAAALGAACDLVIEAGPGAGLARLAEANGLTAMSVDAGGASLRPLLDTLAQAWRMGAPLDPLCLVRDRPARPLDMAAPRMLSNPCGVRGDAPALAAAPAPAPAPVPAPAAPAADALSAVLGAAAEALGLPAAQLSPDARMLEDLHLNSLAVTRLVFAAATRLGIGPPAAATDLVTATLGGLAAHLEELRALGPAAPEPDARIEGAAPWVAEYRATRRPAPWPAPDPDAPALTQIHVGAADGDPFGAPAARALWARLRAAQTAAARHVAILHHGMPLSGLARSLLADGAFDAVALIDVSADPPEDARDRLLRARRPAFADWRLTAEGTLEDTALSPCAPTPADAPDLGPGELLLVTGGARGIGAECALRLGAATGARLLLCGRSAPGAKDVAATLARARALGIDARYETLDLSAPDGLPDLFARHGRPHALIHAAGVNAPARFPDLTDADLDAALGPKLGGLEALIATFGDAPPRLAVGFGSIIGALGLAGECHYALANALMAERLARWGAEAPGMRALAIDWSVWAGAGMGERLGAVERLRADGVDAIPLSAALARFEALVLRGAMAGRVIVTSRFGAASDADFDAPPLPMARFLDRPRLHFPGAELIADTALAPGSDPWLADHVVDGAQVTPGVMMLEAMAEAAAALTGAAPSTIRDLTFTRAAVVPASGLTLRVAAAIRGDGTVEAVIRASDDGFASDCARAVLGGGPTPAPAPAVAPRGAIPAGPLYGALFFNGGRFARLASLTRASAFALRADLSPDPCAPWFGAYLPQAMTLGDPGLRDAGLHALQACVPQRRVLPVGCAEISILDPAAPRATVEAREASSDAETFVFDIAWRGPDGAVVETWRRAAFRAIGPRPLGALPAALLPAALERAAAMATGRTDLRAAICVGARPARRAQALDALGARAATRRGDGAPELPGAALSLSHDADATLAVRADRLAACDLTGPDAPALTDADRALAQGLERGGAAPAFAAAAVWAARECLRKAGAPIDVRLRPAAPDRDGSLELRAGTARILCLPRAGGGCAAILLGDAPALAEAAS